eukprot:TRINITY_DN15606_c0_g1_i1.p2 TRINITY_DN15606_c0_g1~~TRINITY_DN15606_c0_g1_i1.p2  ORF type:complete len:197 (+),score=62.80 TRINITY_DN15606_c0_g1_i1:462-1052(+)
MAVVDEKMADDRGMLLPVEAREFLQRLVRERAPRVALDLGTYLAAHCAIAMASTEVSVFVVAVERQHIHCGLAAAVVEMTGMDNRIKVLNADSRLVCSGADLGSIRFDFVLFDHSPQFFVRDLDLLVEHDRLNPGATVVANVNVRSMTLAAKGTADIIGTEAANYQSHILEHRGFKVVHAPPRSPLHVATYTPAAA